MKSGCSPKSATETGALKDHNSIKSGSHHIDDLPDTHRFSGRAFILRSSCGGRIDGSSSMTAILMLFGLVRVIDEGDLARRGFLPLTPSDQPVVPMSHV